MEPSSLDNLFTQSWGPVGLTGPSGRPDTGSDGLGHADDLPRHESHLWRWANQMHVVVLLLLIMVHLSPLGSLAWVWYFSPPTPYLRAGSTEGGQGNRQNDGTSIWNLHGCGEVQRGEWQLCDVCDREEELGRFNLRWCRPGGRYRSWEHQATVWPHDFWIRFIWTHASLIYQVCILIANNCVL